MLHNASRQMENTASHCEVAQTRCRARNRITRGLHRYSRSPIFGLIPERAVLYLSETPDAPWSLYADAPLDRRSFAKAQVHNIHADGTAFLSRRGGEHNE